MLVYVREMWAIIYVNIVSKDTLLPEVKPKWCPFPDPSVAVIPPLQSWAIQVPFWVFMYDTLKQMPKQITSAQKNEKMELAKGHQVSLWHRYLLEGGGGILWNVDILLARDLIKVTGHLDCKSIRNEEASFSVGDPILINLEDWNSVLPVFPWKSKNTAFVNYFKAF